MNLTRGSLGIVKSYRHAFCPFNDGEKRLTVVDVDAVAWELGVSRPTMYRLIVAYRAKGTVSSVEPRAIGRRKDAFVLDAGRGRLWRGPETLESLACHLPRLRRPPFGHERAPDALETLRDTSPFATIAPLNRRPLRSCARCWCRHGGPSAQTAAPR